MAQHFLDPRNPEKHRCGSITAKELGLPGSHEERIRNFGWYPNPHDWEIGDLVLFARTPEAEARHGGKNIEDIQARQFSKDDARWTHAAIWCGDFLCEANKRKWSVSKSGVQIRYLHEYVGETVMIRVRRVHLDSDQPLRRARIAIHALRRLGERYSVSKALSVKERSVRNQLARRLSNSDSAPLAHAPGLPHIRLKREDAVICSELYVLAAEDALQTVLMEKPHETTPAHLSELTSLRDVEVKWLKVTG